MEGEEEELCCICLSEFTDPISVASIDCNSCNGGEGREDHCFHAECIKEWIVKSSKGVGQSKRHLPKCPLCKQTFRNITQAAGKERLSVADFKRGAAGGEGRGGGGAAERTPRRRGYRGGARVEASDEEEEEGEERESIGSCIVCDEHCIRSSSGSGEQASLFCPCGQCVHRSCLRSSFGRQPSSGSDWLCFLCQNVEIYRQRKRRAQLLRQAAPAVASSSSSSMPPATSTTRAMVSEQISRARLAASQPRGVAPSPAAQGRSGSSTVADSLKLLEAVKRDAAPVISTQQQKQQQQQQRPSKKRLRSELLREAREDLSRR